MNELSTILTKEHVTIGELFARKVAHLLTEVPLTIRTYGVDNGYYSETESITLKINDTQEVSIRLHTSK